MAAAAALSPALVAQHHDEGAWEAWRALSTVQGQVAVGVLFAVAIAAAFELALPPLQRWVGRQAWWPRAIKPQKALLWNLGYPKAPTAAFPEGTSDALALEGYCYVLLTCVHHGLSCLLAVPLLVSGWEASSDAARCMFILSVLSEFGFDIYDFLKRLVALPAMRARFPALRRLSEHAWPEKSFILLGCLHHPLSISLAMPLNLYYLPCEQYHRIVTSLLGAAGLAYFCGCYKFTLDTSSRSGFHTYRFIVLLQWLSIVYTRAFLWFKDASSLVLFLYRRGDVAFACGGLIAALLMTGFNVILLKDASMAMRKWFSKAAPKAVPKAGQVEAAEPSVPRLASSGSAERCVPSATATTSSGASTLRRLLRRGARAQQ